MAGQRRMANIEQFCNQEWTLRLDPQGMRPAEWITVNKFDSRTGQYVNDITAGQVDFIVDQQDYRATLTQAAMDSMFELSRQMATFAPNVVLNLLDLVVENADVPGKEEWVARIRKMTGMRDPSKPPTPEEMQADQENAAKQQRIEEVNIQTAEAKLGELKSKINKTNADRVLSNLQRPARRRRRGRADRHHPGRRPGRRRPGQERGLRGPDPRRPDRGRPGDPATRTAGTRWRRGATRTSIVADGATDLASADVVIADAASVTFSLRYPAAVTEQGKRICRAFIQQKDSNGAYNTIATLDRDNISANISGPLTVRVLRTANASGVLYGVDQS
jgi:hypothetical protein